RNDRQAIGPAPLVEVIVDRFERVWQLHRLGFTEFDPIQHDLISSRLACDRPRPSLALSARWSASRHRMLGQWELLDGEFLAERFGRGCQQADAFGRGIDALLRNPAFIRFANWMRQHHDRQAVVALAAGDDLAERTKRPADERDRRYAGLFE